jgi:integrase
MEFQMKYLTTLRRLAAREPARDERTSLADFLDFWLERVIKPTKRASTYYSYKTTLDNHVANGPLGRIALADLRPLAIQRVLVRDDPSLARSRQLALVILRAALDFAVEQNFIRTNPAAKIRAARVERREIRILDDVQIRRLLAAARHDRFYSLYYVALATGMRQGELLALHWNDIDLAAGAIRVARARDNHSARIGPVKTRAARRSIDIGTDVVEVLREHRRQQEHERHTGQLVWPSATGGTLSPQNVRSRSFVGLQRAAGVQPPVRFHDLRHTHATHLLAAGVNPKVVSERLGHANIAVTLGIYGHTLPTMQKEAASAIGRLLSATPRKSRTTGVKAGVEPQPTSTQKIGKPAKC